ncbi:MAG: AMP-binding protein [Deltaproteobacteria bacterium]|nr:AMP-binding protein [Deltaproteobacteria bacterium]MBW2722889.1 AMP-binding protein [Deltaproteobacteria bacterium]
MSHGLIISGDRRRTREEIFERANRAARGFDAIGVGSGDSVALMLRNDFPFLEVAFAVGRLGAHAVPINWHFLADETEHILIDSAAKAIVVHADLLPQIEAAIPSSVKILVVATPPEIASAYKVSDAAARVPSGRTDYDKWISELEEWTEAPRSSPGAMLYTSGTTGKPKGVRRKPPKPEQMQLGRKIGAQIYGFNPDARAVMTGPMYHIAPNTFGLVIAALGDRLVLQPKFDPLELLRMIEEHAITALNVVPTMFVRLLRLPLEERERYDLSSLTHVVHNAAPCPPDAKRKMIEWWGPVIGELYGGTESGPATACTSEEWLAHPGTVGKALEGSTIKVLDEQGKELPVGEIGEVFMCSSTNSEFTYHGRESERAEIERDGLITLGDMGYLDEDGFLFLCDRKRDMVISGGVNIYPAEIENALIGIDGVADCAVFGIPDAEFGESLLAVIEKAPGSTITAQSVRSQLEGMLARYKVPRRIEFDSDLPREDTGKIYKRKLRDVYWKDASHNI